MPDTKITALTAIGANPIIPATFPIPMVDLTDTTMAASGTTKKVTVNQILGAGGTATLASATITGDLTVRTNKLFVNATGVGVGTTSVFGDFTIQNSSNCRFEVTSSAGGTSIENLNNARNAYLNMTMYADAYIWNRLGSEAMRLNSTGLGVGVVPSAGKGALQLSSGINFPATQVASSDANTLDDYEEGTFTPIISGATTAGTGTYTTQVGRYTKIGRLVTFQLRVAWTAHTGTGGVLVGGLPFTSSSVSNSQSSVTIGFFDNFALTASNIATAFMQASETSIALYQYPVGGGSVSAVGIDSAADIMISGSYTV
jgi:hypothetical protein